VIAMVGMINAINHSDGLDGLASGEVLISLSAMAFLAYQVGGGNEVLIIALAALGAIIGFLRYNTHPAKIFMGDTGSQFLGFTVGFLAILLTQRIDCSMSPAVALLLLGLPVVDILVVLKKRIREGRNWFKASKNHIHHRLLSLGFLHEEAVIVIYSAQILCVTTGVLFCYRSDWLLL
jgi:UDP-GlcNAc:undecaprenyl-phosphate GlcNAc-1-phosphate transferase